MAIRSFSIVRRLTILIVAVSGVLLCLNAYLLLRTTQPMAQHQAGTLTRGISAIRTALEQAAPGRRDAMAGALRFSGFPVYRASSAPPYALAQPPFELPPLFGPSVHGGLPFGRPPPPRSGIGSYGGPPPNVLRPPLGVSPDRDAWAAQLRSKLDFDIDLSWRHTEMDAPPLLRVRFLVDGDAWVVDLAGGERPPLGPLALLLLVAVGLAAAVATIAGVRWITRPMERLAGEVAARQRELRPIRDMRPVATELRPLVDAFNGLVGSVAEADATRKQLLAGLSHDLRTPLARLRLRMECMCPEAQLESMEHDFQALQHIVDQFLAYSQGETDVALGAPEPLGVIAQRVAKSHAGGVRVEIEDAAAAALLVPDLALHRMLTNLLDNALAHGAAPVVLRIRSSARQCELLVLDGGPGIAAARLDEALRPFVRLQASRPGVGHCGLGLAIVAQITRRLHGDVFLQPFDGQCSGVGVALPFPEHI